MTVAFDEWWEDRAKGRPFGFHASKIDSRLVWNDAQRAVMRSLGDLLDELEAGDTSYHRGYAEVVGWVRDRLGGQIP